jgi:hypothetical protein
MILLELLFSKLEYYSISLEIFHASVLACTKHGVVQTELLRWSNIFFFYIHREKQLFPIILIFFFFVVTVS